MRAPGIEAAVVLCAGGSRRMGRAKGLLPLGGRPLLAHHVEALAPWASRVIVVLGAEAEAHRAVLPAAVEVVPNPAWATTWPADSLRLALRERDVRGACWVTPVDVPPAAPATLAALHAAGAPAVPVDGEGRPGHPVLLDAELVGAVRGSAPDGGLRTLLGEARRVPVHDPLVAADFDEPEAWAVFASRHG